MTITTMKTTRGGIITGWGIAVPDKVVTNDDLSVTMDTNDAWIRERTGIRERRIGGTTSQLAIEAGLAALAKAGRRPDEIDGGDPGHHHARPDRARAPRPPCRTASASPAGPSTSTPPAPGSSTPWPWPTGCWPSGPSACWSSGRRP